MFTLKSFNRSIFIIKFHHQLIHKWSIWLHHIICQTVSIIFIAMVHTPCRQQSTTHQCPSHHSTQYCITIIEHIIWSNPLSISDKILYHRESLFPIECSSTSLKIHSIATTHIACPPLHIRHIHATHITQYCGLILYFSHNRLLPKLLLQRLRSL